MLLVCVLVPVGVRPCRVNWSELRSSNENLWDEESKVYPHFSRAMAATATCSTRLSTGPAATGRRPDRSRRTHTVVSAVGQPDGDDSAVDVSRWVPTRRGALLMAVAGTTAWAQSPRPTLASEPSATGVGKPLRPLAEYRTALDGAVSELDAVCTELRNAAGSTTGVDEFDVPAYAAPLDAAARASFARRLHADELGAFWVTSRGTDRYMAGERSPFARDTEDLWKLLPEKSGPLGKVLQPDFDNPDDKLCLIYSCVNDPRAPPSIDVLYSLKLLDEGLNTEGVTAAGLLGNAEDCLDKLQRYSKLVDDNADATLVDADWRNPAKSSVWRRVGI